jgi:hypothetical protein
MKRLHNVPQEQTMPAVRRQGRVLTCFAAALIFLASGCAVPTRPPDDGRTAAGAAADQQILDQGIEAFQTGDYRKAGKLFERMSRSKDPQVARKALYGLSCTRLTLADGSPEYAAALTQWQAWSRQAPLKYQAEDPRMLAPLLVRFSPPAVGKNQPPEKKPAAKQPSAIPLKRYQACQNKIQELETRIGNMEAQKKLLQYYVDYTTQLEKEIWNLKHKINSLEAIDKKILEKKKELSSP